MRKLITMGISALFTISLWGYDVGDYSYSYNMSTKEGTITGYSGTSSVISIPTSFSVPETYKDEDDGEMHTRYHTIHVVGIGSSVFANKTFIKSVSFHSKLKSVGSSAFSGCTGIVGVDLSTVETIGDNAFRGCTSLTDIDIPSSVSSMGSGIFESCTKLTEVRFHNDLRGTIPSRLFNGCANLVSVSISIPNVSSIGDYAFSGCKSLGFGNVDFNNLKSVGAYAFQECLGLTGVTFFSGLTSIGEHAFDSCANLSQTLETPSTLKSFGSFAFTKCSGLTQIVIDGNGVSVGAGAFSECSNIVDVVIGDGVVGIAGNMWRPNECAFHNCGKIKTIHVGVGVTIIGQSVFEDLGALEYIEFDGKLTEIGMYAFYGCGVLETLRAPNAHLTRIADFAFGWCSQLPKLDCSLEYVISIGEMAFEFCGQFSLDGVAFQSLESVSRLAFWDCSGITTLKFGPKLKSFTSNAFADCNNLNSVTFTGPPPEVGTHMFSPGAVFEGCASGAHGYYPPAYAAEWQAVINPSTKKWQGLIMEEVPSPQLVIDSVSWSDFTLSLSWGKTTTGVDVTGPCSLYRGTSEDISQATCILKDSLATTYTDSSFLDVSPKTKPLYYWVVPAGGDLSMASMPVVTRKRYSYCIGYDHYWPRGFGPTLRTPETVAATLYDANEFRRVLVDNCGVLESDAVIGKNETTSDMKATLEEFELRVGKGDMFFFYIATHGGQSSFWGEAALVTRDSDMPASSLQLLLSRINAKGAAVVTSIMACHSEEMKEVLTLGNGNLDLFLESGLAQCSASMAWVTSCHASQKSIGYSGGEFTMFGRDFIGNGLIRGFADRRLIRTVYNGGNEDGEVNFLELARYAHEFSRGWNDDNRAEVNWDNEVLLSRIVVAEVQEVTLDAPGRVENVVVESGTSWNKLKVSWDKTEGADYYWVYRRKKGVEESKKVISYMVDRNDGQDELSVFELMGEYEYSVVAVNAIGRGEESLCGVGSTGLGGGGTGWKTDQKDGRTIVKSVKVYDDSSTEWKLSEIMAGMFTFSWQTSCESAFELPNGETTPRDHAEFLVDGEVVATSDGESTWKQVSVNLSGGRSHTVTWRYVKDGSGSAGEDCVWISDIQFAAIADEVSSGDLLDESDYNWFYETTPTAFTESEPFEYNPVLTPENATCQIDICAAIGEVESSALLEEDVEDAQAAIVKVAGAFGLDYAVLTADGWTMVGNGGLGAEGNDGDKISVVIDYAAKPSKVKYMVSGHTLTNADGVALFECAAQKSSVQALVAKGDGTIDCWAGKYEVVNSDVQFVEEGSEIELAANLDVFPSETFQVTGGGTLVIPSDKIPVGGVNRKLHVDGNSKVRFDLSGSGTIPSVTRLFNGVGGAFVIGDNIQLVVPGEGVERVSKLFVKDGNLEARVAERPTIDDGDGSDSAFKVNADSDSTAVSASIGNAVEGFWYGLLTTSSLTSDFLLDRDSVKQCTSSGVLKLESSANSDSDVGFYRVSVSTEEP